MIDENFEEIDMAVKNNKKKNIEISILGKGQVFGEVEILSNSLRKFTIICNSDKGEVLKISKRDFLRKIVELPEFSSLKHYNKMKSEWYDDHSNLIKKNLNSVNDVSDENFLYKNKYKKNENRKNYQLPKINNYKFDEENHDKTFIEENKIRKFKKGEKSRTINSAQTKFNV